MARQGNIELDGCVRIRQVLAHTYGMHRFALRFLHRTAASTLVSNHVCLGPLVQLADERLVVGHFSPLPVGCM